MQNQLISKQKLFIIGIGLLLLIAVVVFLKVQESQKNSFGDEIEITNLKDETSKSKEPSEKMAIDYVQYALLGAVNMNVEKPIEDKQIKDAQIRSGTFNQTYSKEHNVYTVTFIVDIESLQQSYQASYQWAKDKKSKYSLDEWGSNVRCLPQSKLIYEDFKCKDMFTEMGGEEESIIKHLPHSTLSYRITLGPSMPYVLNIVISTNAADERGDAKAAIEKYKNQANEWIRSVGFDPQDYTINYTYKRASVY